ncbi:DUF4179 domain-containing protein [Vagococcus sp. PNs007]|uniref:DUF4179 domain-containing protein n=1 Tax=Vagococcus proximus TaxID=2991417 RepID=A0ABT5X1N3_9ENTE|nr:DUF4179 domain-containing protein [Vagococcus proximus]MDF0479911.1 DUF4179 domain-containing protein [Vagococcus proximus]
MNDKQIKEKMAEIEVPKEALENAVKQGMNRAKQEEVASVGKGMGRIGKIILSAVAVGGLFVGSGYLIPSLGEVYADIPFVGKLFQRFDPNINLASTSLSELDLVEPLETDGLTIHVIGSYYDAGKIDIVYQIVSTNRDKKSDQKDLKLTVDVGESPLIKGNDVSNDMRESENGEALFDGQLTIDLSQDKIPDKMMVPLIVDTGGKKKKINVPVEKVVSQALPSGYSVSTETEEGRYTATITKVLKGESRTMVDYKIEQPKGTSVDASWAWFMGKDKNGQEVEWPIYSTGALVKVEKSSTSDIGSYRAILPNRYVDNEGEEENVLGNVSVKFDIANAPKNKPVVAVKDNFPRVLPAKDERFTMEVMDVTEAENKIVMSVTFPNLAEDYSKDDLEQSLAAFTLGNKEYVSSNTVPDEYFTDPTTFLHKEPVVTDVHFEQGQGWLGTVSFDLKKLHGFGKNKHPKYDRDQAYIGGNISSQNVSLGNLELDLGE